MNFITPAIAQSSAAANSGSDLFLQMAPLGIIFLIMYFLMIRPQQKRAKQTAEMLSNIRRGDTIITAGGLIGKVTKVSDASEVEVEIAVNVRVRIARQMIVEVRAKGEPVKETAA